jgi:serine/threonine-protein kinase
VYLRGLEYYERRTGWERYPIALEMFDSAVALDSDFALAHAKRATTHLLMSTSGYDGTITHVSEAVRLAHAKEALDHAVRLDPERAEVQIASCWYYSQLGDTGRALEHLNAALRSSPNDVEALQSLADLHIWRRHLDSASVLLEKLGDLDPRSVQTAGFVSWGYARLGRYEDAIRHADRPISLAADQPSPYRNKAWLQVLAGDTAAAHQALQLGAERNGLIDLLLEVAQNTNTVRMLRIFSEYGEIMRGLSQDAFGADTADYLIAKFHSYHEMPDLARPYFDSLAHCMTASLEADPERPDVRHALRVQAYAGSGRTEATIREADAVLRWFGTQPGGVPNLTHMVLAESYVMVGEFDAAVEQLRSAMSSRGMFSRSVLRLDPIWDPLRDHPEFQELLESGN